MSDWNLSDQSIVFARWRHIPTLLYQFYYPVAITTVARSAVFPLNWASMITVNKEHMASWATFVLVLMGSPLHSTPLTGWAVKPQRQGHIDGPIAQPWGWMCLYVCVMCR